jgi:hypothetical protein
MSYSIEKLPVEPIILYTAHPDHNVAAELQYVIADLRELLDVQEEPVYFVNDLRNGPSPSVEDLLKASTLLARGDNPIYQHPNIRKLLVVSTDRIVRMAYQQGGSSATFGSIGVEVFETMEEAMEFVRSGG